MLVYLLTRNILRYNFVSTLAIVVSVSEHSPETPATAGLSTHRLSSRPKVPCRLARQSPAVVYREIETVEWFSSLSKAGTMRLQV